MLLSRPRASLPPSPRVFGSRRPGGSLFSWHQWLWTDAVRREAHRAVLQACTAWLYNPLRLWEASASSQCTRTPGGRGEIGCRCQRARAQGCPLGGRTPSSSETPWAGTASVPFPQGRWKVWRRKRETMYYNSLMGVVVLVVEEETRYFFFLEVLMTERWHVFMCRFLDLIVTEELWRTWLSGGMEYCGH